MGSNPTLSFNQSVLLFKLKMIILIICTGSVSYNSCILKKLLTVGLYFSEFILYTLVTPDEFLNNPSFNLLFPEIIFALQMKKLIAIFFISLLGVHFAPAFGGFTQQSVACMDIEKEKHSDKSKDTLKEKLEKKEFDNDRYSDYTVLLQHIIHNEAVNCFFQRPVTDILTPPPNC